MTDRLWVDDSALEQLADAITGWVGQADRGARAAEEAVRAIDSALHGYLSEALLAPCADVYVATEFALAAVGELEARHGPLLGRSADLFRAHLDAFLAGSAGITELHFRLGDLEARAAAGDPGAPGDAIAWFEGGRPMPSGVAARLVEVLHRAGAVVALGQLLIAWGYAERCGVRRAALDALTHLAGAPGETGRVARGELLDLAGHPELSGAVAVRLPVHLLDAPQRVRLRELVEEWERFAPASDPWIAPDVITYSRLALRDVLMRVADVDAFDLI